MAFKGIRLPIPSAMSEYNFSIDEFKGIDKASGEDNFSPHRAVSARNFIRDKVGRVKKRGGFGAINKNDDLSIRWVGAWNNDPVRFIGNTVEVGDIDVGVIDVGFVLADEVANELGIGTRTIKYAVNDAIGVAHGDDYYLFIDFKYEIGESATQKYVLVKLTKSDDGLTSTEIIALDHTLAAAELSSETTGTVGPIGQIVATVMKGLRKFDTSIPVPVIVEGASPLGGGSLMQSANMLSPLVQETFTVTESDLTDGVCKRFQLSSQNISLTDGEKFISSSDWMNTQKEYWTQEEKKSRKLTKNGAAVANKSVKIEVYTKITTGGTETTEKTEEYEWQTVQPFSESSTNFINTKLGALWIPAAEIGASPVEGQPNVRITYIRNHEEYLEDVEKICACTQSVCFGVGGYKDRVFLAGGNRIYYSGMDDPLYFGELCYIEPCSADKEIMALGCQGQYLYAVDSDGVTHVIAGTVTEDDANTYMSEAAFVIADRVQGEKPTIHSALKIFGEEFCYVSEEGLVAIHHDNFYDKRYAQNRSRLLGDSIKGKIKDATVWGNFLVLATATELYLLDELQQTTLPDYKYSGKQYEVFPFTFDMSDEGLGKFTIDRVWTSGSSLYFQLKLNGDYYEMKYVETSTRDHIVESDDNGLYGDITAEWITPPLALSSPRYRKLIHHLHLSLGTNDSGSAVKVEYRTDYSTERENLNTGWKTLREADGRFIPFNYGSLNYAMFNYGGILPKLQLIIKRRPAKYFRKIQFRFTSAGEYALSLADFGFTYEKEVI